MAIMRFVFRVLLGIAIGGCVGFVFVLMDRSGYSPDVQRIYFIAEAPTVLTIVAAGSVVGGLIGRTWATISHYCNKQRDNAAR